MQILSKSKLLVQVYMPSNISGRGGHVTGEQLPSCHIPPSKHSNLRNFLRKTSHSHEGGVKQFHTNTCTDSIMPVQSHYFGCVLKSSKLTGCLKVYAITFFHVFETERSLLFSSKLNLFDKNIVKTAKLTLSYH